MKRCLTALCMLVVMAVGAKAADQVKFEGTIGSYEVVFVYSKTQRRMVQYYYKSRPQNVFKLVLEKQVSCNGEEFSGDGCNKCYYHEVAPGGKITGRMVWTENWYLHYNESTGRTVNKISINGTFTNTSNKKKFKISIYGGFTN